MAQQVTVKLLRVLFLGAMMGFWFFITLFLQSVYGYSPLAAGVAFLRNWLKNLGYLGCIDHDHPHAVRILARAWIYVIWRCRQDHKPYDPTQHRGLQKPPRPGPDRGRLTTPGSSRSVRYVPEPMEAWCRGERNCSSVA